MNTPKDPATDLFLQCLAKDIDDTPETSVVAVPQGLFDRMKALVGAVVIDMDAPIEGDVAISEPPSE